MLKINYDKALSAFRNYVNLQKTFTHKSDNTKKQLGIDSKYIHSLEVVHDGNTVIKNLQFNPSFVAFCKMALLNHDIGRFKQIIITGNFNDDDLAHKTGIENHGLLGKIILEDGILKEQIPDTRVFDEGIIQIVQNHVTGSSTYNQLQILNSNLFKNEDIYDIFKTADNSLKKDIIAAITQIVQDVDRLDIYHQILSDRWSPLKSEVDIPLVVFEKFYQGQFLNMSQLKKQGLWNSNVGELIRLSFINQIRLYSVAKMILDENIILKLKTKRNNPKVKDAFDYTHQLLKEMVNSSEDGITVSKKVLKIN